MNIQKILQGVARLTGVNQNRLSEAARQASQYRDVNSKEEALNTLHNLGIDNSFLDRVQGMLDTPVARTIGSIIGMNPRQASNAIDQLKTSPNASRHESNRLAMFKKDLDRVKKYK